MCVTVFFPGRFVVKSDARKAIRRPYSVTLEAETGINPGVVASSRLATPIVDDGHFGAHDFDYRTQCWQIDTIIGSIIVVIIIIALLSSCDRTNSH